MTLPAAFIITGPVALHRDILAAQLQVVHGYAPMRLGQTTDDILLDLNPLLAYKDGQPVRLFDVVYNSGWDEAERLFPETERLRESLQEIIPRHSYPEILADNLTSQTSASRSLTGMDDRWTFPDVRTDAEIAALQNWFGLDRTRIVHIAPAHHTIDLAAQPYDDLLLITTETAYAAANTYVRQLDAEAQRA